MGMRKIASALAASMLALSLSAPPAFAWATKGGFSDVDPGGWYAEVVAWCAENGYMGGYGNSDRFGVGNNLTRAEMAAIVMNISGADPVSPQMDTTGMADLAGVVDWYTGVCNWAVANGIINGFVNGDGTRTFAPNDPVTREQAVAILHNFKKPAYSPALGTDPEQARSYLSFWAVDGGEVQDFALIPMKWAVQQGLMKGSGALRDCRIDPGRSLLREEAAALVKRLHTVTTEFDCDISVTFTDGSWTSYGEYGFASEDEIQRRIDETKEYVYRTYGEDAVASIDIDLYTRERFHG